MWIDEKTVDQIRDQVNIIDIISNYVQLNKQGQNHFGHCPFHEDRSPSLSVHEKKQFYHCFSCGRGGNVFSFIMEIEGLTFPEAVIKVAELADITVDQQLSQSNSSVSSKKKTGRDILLELYQTAQTFYQQVLTQTETGSQARTYLHQRGLTDSTIEEFQLGYSPKQKNALAEYVQAQLKLDESYLDQSELFYQAQDGDYLDRFSQRLIFPIFNQKSELVAFSGRYLDFNQATGLETPPAKYINSTDTAIFNKSQTLFNFSKARPEIRRKNEVILFEGYMDVIAGWQAGVKNGVASMGTSLTKQQIQILEKVCDKLVIAYDGDQAGQEATYRVLELLDGHLFDVEVIQFEQGLDPDDFIQNKGAEAFQHFIQHSRLTRMGFYLEYYKRQRNLGNESEQLDYIQDILEKLVTVPQAIERELVFQQLSDLFQIDQLVLKDEFDRLLRQKRHQQLKNHKKKIDDENNPQADLNLRFQSAPQSFEKAEDIILYRLFQYPEEVYPLLIEDEDFEFQTESAHLLAIIYQEFYQTTDQANLVKFIDYLQENKLRQRLTRIETMTMTDSYSEEEVKDSLDYLKQLKIRQQIQSLKTKMKEAAEQADVSKQEEYLYQIIKLTQKIEANF